MRRPAYLRRCQTTAAVLAATSLLFGCGGGSDGTRPASAGGAGSGGASAQPGAPVIVRTIPADGSTGHPTDGWIEVVFSQSMDPASITQQTIALFDAQGRQVGADLFYDESVLAASIAPQAPLAPNATYTVSVMPGVRDVNGLALAGTGGMSATFTTAPGAATHAPSFAGLATAQPDGAGGADLAWTAATDPAYAAGDLYYTLHVGATAAQIDWSHYHALLPFGATRAKVTGLGAGTTTFFGVRAWNLSGKNDGNTHAVAVTIPNAAPQRTAPTFAGARSASAQSTSSILVSWSAASDTVDAASAIVYEIYVATTSHGQNFAAASGTTQPGATQATLTGLQPATTYYAVVRARNTAGLRDANTVEVSATTQQAAAPAPSFRTDIEAGIFQNPSANNARTACVDCHGGTQNLYLDTYANVLRGGRSGPGVTPNNLSRSMVYQELTSPSAAGASRLSQHRVSDAVKQTLQAWIMAGAPNN
jgi:hypothetical protein